MKKVVYTVTKFGRTENTKMSGLGYITESDLITACISKNGKPYIRVFEDCVKNCHKVTNTTNEYKGAHYEVIPTFFICAFFTPCFYFFAFRRKISSTVRVVSFAIKYSLVKSTREEN